MSCCVAEHSPPREGESGTSDDTPARIQHSQREQESTRLFWALRFFVLNRRLDFLLTAAGTGTVSAGQHWRRDEQEQHGWICTCRCSVLGAGLRAQVTRPFLCHDQPDNSTPLCGKATGFFLKAACGLSYMEARWGSLCRRRPNT